MYSKKNENENYRKNLPLVWLKAVILFLSKHSGFWLHSHHPLFASRLYSPVSLDWRLRYTSFGRPVHAAVNSCKQILRQFPDWLALWQIQAASIDWFHVGNRWPRLLKRSQRVTSQSLNPAMNVNMPWIDGQIYAWFNLWSGRREIK